MKTISDLMDAFGGVSAFGRVIGKGASAASEMKRRGSIPVVYWPVLISAASRQEIAGVTAEMLMCLHAPPAPANDMAPAVSGDVA